MSGRPVIPDRKPTTCDRWWEGGYSAAMSAMLETVCDMLAAGHDHASVLHAVMHVASSADMLRCLDDSDDRPEVLSTGWSGL